MPTMGEPTARRRSRENQYVNAWMGVLFPDVQFRLMAKHKEKQIATTRLENQAEARVMVTAVDCLSEDGNTKDWESGDRRLAW